MLLLYLGWHLVSAKDDKCKDGDKRKVNVNVEQERGMEVMVRYRSWTLDSSGLKLAVISLTRWLQFGLHADGTWMSCTTNKTCVGSFTKTCGETADVWIKLPKITNLTVASEVLVSFSSQISTLDTCSIGYGLLRVLCDLTSNSAGSVGTGRTVPRSLYLLNRRGSSSARTRLSSLTVRTRNIPGIWRWKSKRITSASCR